MSNHTEHMNHRCECADDGPVIVATFGGLVMFDSYESAHHTGVKCFDYKLEILRRPKDSDAEWETAQPDGDN